MTDKKVSYFNPKAYVPNDFKEETDKSGLSEKDTVNSYREHLEGNCQPPWELLRYTLLRHN